MNQTIHYGHNYNTIDFNVLAPCNLVNLVSHYYCFSRRACPVLDHTNLPDLGPWLQICSGPIDVQQF